MRPMLELMPHKLLAFVLASVILAVVPGPAVIYLMTQTLSRGRRAGLASVAGVALGNLMNAGVASFGLAAILATSATAFSVVKLAGAAYLIWLGIKALRNKPAPVRQARQADVRPLQLFRDGVVVAFLNPKTALFFAALLPQFVDPASRTPLAQNLVFGSV